MLLIAFVISGCGYRAGRALPGLGPDVKTVAIPIFRNSSPEPLIETVLTQAVREVFINDGRLEVAPEEGADLILRGEITGYGRRVLAFDAADRAAEVRVKVDVNFILKERRSGRELADLNLQARSEYSVSQRLPEHERARKSAELRAFKELARELIEVLLSGL